MLSSGDEIELTIDKPAAGGRMLARHDGQVVFVLVNTDRTAAFFTRHPFVSVRPVEVEERYDGDFGHVVMLDPEGNEFCVA